MFFKVRFKPRLKPKKHLNTTVNGVCYKSKTLKNSEYPIILRIYKQEKEFS